MSWSFNICSHKFIFFPNHSTLTDKCLWTLFFHLILHANHLNVEWNHIKWLNWMFSSLFLATYFNLLNKKSFRAQFSFHRHCFLFFFFVTNKLLSWSYSGFWEPLRSFKLTMLFTVWLMANLNPFISSMRICHYLYQVPSIPFLAVYQYKKKNSPKRHWTQPLEPFSKLKVRCLYSEDWCFLTHNFSHKYIYEFQL